MLKNTANYALGILLSVGIVGATKCADILTANQSLSNGAYISSPNGKYSLIMQTDGSLVMYRNNGSIRYSMEKRGTYAVMQSDGNFVEYAGSTPLWSTGTAGCCLPTWPQPYLRITDDGNLRVESLGPAPVWQIGPDPEPIYTSTGYPMVLVYPSGTGPSSPPPLPATPLFDNSVQYNMNPRY